MPSWTFLEDPEAEEFVMEWNQEVFEEGKVGLRRESFILIRGTRKLSRDFMKKIGFVFGFWSVLLFLMLAFALWNNCLWRVEIILIISSKLPIYFFFFSIYLILILHELGHAFWISDRLSSGGFWLGTFSSDQKLGRFHLSRTAVLKKCWCSVYWFERGWKWSKNHPDACRRFDGSSQLAFIGRYCLDFWQKSWYFAATWFLLICLFFLNDKPFGITDGAKFGNCYNSLKNTKYAYLMLRHSAQTLASSSRIWFKRLYHACCWGGEREFCRKCSDLQGLVFILDDNIELAKQQFQSC